MANRRMISKSISTSKQVNSISDFAQLLFTWAIAHADDFGLLDGDPDVVWATVIPMKRSRTTEEVEVALTEWVKAELVWWYEVEGQKVIQFRTWEKHQSGLHKRTTPKYVSYDIAKKSDVFRELPGTSVEFPPNRTELNRTEVNYNNNTRARAEVVIPPSPTETLAGLYERHFGGLANPFLLEDLDAYIRDGPMEIAVIELAFRKSRECGEGFKYAKGILRSWTQKGIYTVQSAVDESAEFERRKENGLGEDRQYSRSRAGPEESRSQGEVYRELRLSRQQTSQGI